MISRPGLRSSEPPAFRIKARICQFQSADRGVNTRVVPLRGLAAAASLTMFQLWVQEGATQTALAKSCPLSVTESFVHVGDVIMRRQDTSCARVQVTEPFVGDMRVAQVFDPCALQTPGSCPNS